MNGKGSAETIVQFELYPPLCIHNVEQWRTQKIFMGGFHSVT